MHVTWHYGAHREREVGIGQRLDVELRNRLADTGPLLVIDVNLRIDVGLRRLRCARLLLLRRARLLRRRAAGLLLLGIAGSRRLLLRRVAAGVRLLCLVGIGWRRVGRLLR
jgi:hypothetical protein